MVLLYFMRQSGIVNGVRNLTVGVVLLGKRIYLVYTSVHVFLHDRIQTSNKILFFKVFNSSKKAWSLTFIILFIYLLFTIIPPPPLHHQMKGDFSFPFFLSFFSFSLNYRPLYVSLNLLRLLSFWVS